MSNQPSSGAAPKRITFFSLLLIFGLAIVLDTFVAYAMSATFDEPDFIDYGTQMLHFHPERSQHMFDSKTPVAALNAFPRGLASYLAACHAPGRIVAVLRELRVARLASILALLLLNFIVYVYARDLYGPSAALAGSLIVVFSPNLIAHGTLATEDGYFALGVIASLYLFRRYLLQPTLTNACLSCLTLALAQTTKPFAMYLYGVAAIFLLIFSLIKTRVAPAQTRKHVITYVAIAIISFLLVINIGYYFRGTFTPLRSYQFESALFERLQNIPVLRNLPVPFPYVFLQGLDMMKYYDDTAVTYGNIYLLGELRNPLDPHFHNFKSYYAVALFFKEPIALQILFVLGLIWVWKNRGTEEFLLGEGLLLTAAGLLFVWMSLFRKSQIGIRNILPALAVGVVIAAAAFSGFDAMSLRKKMVLAVLVLWLCASMLSYYPHLIPYMNEFVFDRKLSYKILVDSNLDWGQNADLVDRFLRNNPDVVLNPVTPVSGRVLVRANRLAGIYHKSRPILWLSPYRPVRHVGYAHLLFVVPPSQTVPEARSGRQ